MKPNNLPSKNCTNQSSNCIVWDGPNIDCINLCKGETVTWAIYNLGKELCAIMDQLNLTNYDLTCLTSNNCSIPDFKALIQILINKICALEGNTSSSSSSFPSTLTFDENNCPDCMVTLAPYFRYQNPANGDMVTEALLVDYVKLIANAVASIVVSVNTQGRAITDLNARVTELETDTQTPYTLPKLFPACIDTSSISISLDVFAQLLEQKFCELQSASGTANEMFNAIAEPEVANMKNEDALGTTGGKMGSLTDWVADPTNMADFLRNAWLAIKDLRSAVRNIQLNCCNSTCNDIEVGLQVTMPTTNTLKFYLTGTIPDAFQNCLPSGTLFKVADQSGNFINVTIDVKANLNVAEGFSVSIAGSPLNVADDFTITATLCMMHTENNSLCQSELSYYLVNTIDCPVITWTPGETTISYNFDHTGGALTYSIQLFNSGNTMVASMNVAVTGPTNVNGVFNGLSPNTVYKGRVQMITLEHTKTCPFTVVTTGGDSCPAPNNVTAILTIP